MSTIIRIKIAGTEYLAKKKDLKKYYTYVYLADSLGTKSRKVLGKTANVNRWKLHQHLGKVEDLLSGAEHFTVLAEEMVARFQKIPK